VAPSSECEKISDNGDSERANRWRADEESSYIDGESSADVTHSLLGEAACSDGKRISPLFVPGRGKEFTNGVEDRDPGARCRAGPDNCEMSVNVRDPWGSVPGDPAHACKRVILTTFLPENGSLV